jgi:serine phosphatase RsbU (regulator of sigma subunit)
MEVQAKRFTRRVLLAHFLVLGIVLALIGLTAREIYKSTVEQVLAQAESRQMLLGNVAAHGIESYYQSILNNLDLLRGAENEEPTTAPARPTQSQLAERAIGNTSRGNFLGPILWKQLQGRVSLLFGVDRQRLGQPNPAVRLIGSDDPNLKPEEIVVQSRQWLETVQTPSIGSFQKFGDTGANLVCIPFPRGRLLIAVVPIHEVEDRFLKSVNEDPDTAAWLVDERKTAMAASRSPLVGLSMTAISAPRVQQLAADEHYDGDTQVVTQSFNIGSTHFGPSMVSEDPISVGGKHWQLFISTSMGQIDRIISRLFHRAFFWGIFVVVSITAILVSTALQLIRSRLRLERERHILLTRELNQAREIQLAWLPDGQPSIKFVELAAVNSPASHISGDFYNWFELPDGRLVVTIGDVTGHGMAAAFLMATTQLLVRNTMVRLGDAGRCLQEVNRQLCVQIFNGQFVTMLILILDVVAGEVEIATAGHPAPLLGDGHSFQPLPMHPQLVLGVDRETTFATQRFPLPPNSNLLLYTDGAVDCTAPNGSRFTIASLKNSLTGDFDSAQAILDKVTTTLATFRGPRELDDDLTLVAIHLQPISAEPHALAATV